MTGRRERLHCEGYGDEFDRKHLKVRYYLSCQIGFPSRQTLSLIIIASESGSGPATGPGSCIKAATEFGRKMEGCKGRGNTSFTEAAFPQVPVVMAGHTVTSLA